MSLRSTLAVPSLALIMAFRILGLFMILPVLSAHAVTIPGATPTLIGIALGIYGLTQACLQTPFGLLSDHIGRKPIIAIGLLLFAAGSLVAALATNIQELILGRAFQGTGAIGSTALAYVADLTRDESRSKAMAFIGLSIGLAFSVAMVLGPIVYGWKALSGIFWLTVLFAGLGLLILAMLPKPPQIIVHRDTEVEPKRLKTVFKNPQLLRLNFGIFSLHLMLTALFIAIPILLTHVFKLTPEKQTLMYTGVLLVSFLFMLPLIIIGEKKRKMKPLLLFAISCLALSQFLFYQFLDHPLAIATVLVLFFTCFNLLEASLPSLISKISPINAKGTAMGIYSTSQYLGICVGGSLGGFLLAHYGIYGIFFLGGVTALLWLVIAITMKQPPYLSTLIFSVTKKGRQLTETLTPLSGVYEVRFSPSESVIYVKIDKQKINEDELRKRIEEVTLA